MRHILISDASVLDQLIPHKPVYGQGIGWSKIYYPDKGIRYKGTVSRVSKGGSTQMEIISIHRSLKLIPDFASLVICTDCEVVLDFNYPHVHSSRYHEERYLSPTLKLAFNLLQELNRKNLTYEIVGKEMFKQDHDECHNNCIKFRELMSCKYGLSFNLYRVNKDYTVTFTSSHSSIGAAEKARMNMKSAIPTGERKKFIVSRFPKGSGIIKCQDGKTWVEVYESQ